jgi:AraC family transcriptional regulator of adaptative response/methylated-DNA-[protein]-cysteine methyltransferase
MIWAREDGERLSRLTARTALGDFVVVATGRGLHAVTPLIGRGDAPPDSAGPDDALHVAHAAAAALRRYGAGTPIRHQTPLDVMASAFHVAVWERVRAIPFGTTATYGEIAAALGAPGDARAVGAALAANPACILVPCHRVVAADGALRGFAWGLDLKRRLLAHEGRGTRSLFADQPAFSGSSSSRRA